MKKHIKLNRTLAILSVALVVIAILVVATPILQPKYLSVSAEGSLTAEYYPHVADTPHDVLFIGDCEVYESFVPALLYEEYGISAYVRGSAQQLIWQSYYLLEDALRYETPQVVVFNVLAMKYGTPQSEAYNRMTLDGMAWSQVKVDAINASMTEEESFASYVWTLLRFHDRWNQLTTEDFTYAFKEKPIVSDSGYLLQTAIRPMVGEAVAGSPLADYTLPQTSFDYLDKMRQLCEANGIQLVLIKAPTNTFGYWWYDQWDDQIVEYASENGLAYYNFIEQTDEIGIDYTTDTYDEGVHLNVYGAEKMTEYFGRILAERHGLADIEHSEEQKTKWQTRVDAYYKERNE